MARYRVLIAAAGAGTRAGLPYPKTLHPVDGRPILGRILDVVGRHDPCPTIVVAPSGHEAIAQFLAAEGQTAHLVEQARPTGMGDAVLAFDQSPAASEAETIILVWGDIPFLSDSTLDATLTHHHDTAATLTFPSAITDRAYTVVSRGDDGVVYALDETRLLGVEPSPGERDIGLFVFNATPVLTALRQSAARHDPARAEHGFLHIVRQLATAGYRVEATAVATLRETISLNALADLEAKA